jgi:hypothetical protein
LDGRHGAPGLRVVGLAEKPKHLYDGIGSARVRQHRLAECCPEAEGAASAETSPAQDTWATTVAASRDNCSSTSSHPDWIAQAADRRHCRSALEPDCAAECDCEPAPGPRRNQGQGNDPQRRRAAYAKPGQPVRVVVPRAARAGDLHRVATQSCGHDAAHERFVVVRVARQALTRFVRAALHRVASRRPTLCSRLLGPVNLVRNAGFAATTGVSCASASSCTAAIGGGVGTFNGSSWSGPVCPGGDPSSLSCPSSAFCLAGDSTGHVIRDDDGSWGAPVSVDPGPAFRCPAPAARSAPLSMRTGMR